MSDIHIRDVPTWSSCAFKKLKSVQFVLQISPWKQRLQKNEVHHDVADGKFYNTVISDFLFLQRCFTTKLYKNQYFIKKLVIFSGHPLPCLTSKMPHIIRDWILEKDGRQIWLNMSPQEALEEHCLKIAWMSPWP